MIWGTVYRYGCCSEQVVLKVAPTVESTIQPKVNPVRPSNASKRTPRRRRVHNFLFGVSVFFPQIQWKRLSPYSL